MDGITSKETKDKNEGLNDNKSKDLAKKKRGVSMVVRRDEDLNNRIDFILAMNPLLQNDSDVARHSIIETSKALGYNG